MPVAKTEGHLRTTAERPSAPAPSSAPAIPQPVRQAALPPPPVPKAVEIKYSIVVNDIPAREVLFAIARETKVNIDIHPGIEGRVTLNAIDQTIRQILTRMAKQVDMRWEADGPNIAVMPDSPFLRTYKVDYVNMNRDSTGSIGVQTQVVNLQGSQSGQGSSGQNSSMLKVDNNAKNRFWETLEKNIKDMLRETDKLLPEGSSETFVRGSTQGNVATTRPQTPPQRRTASTQTQQSAPAPTIVEGQAASESLSQTLTFREAASVIVNPETGTVVVRATSRQHEKVAEFIGNVSGSAQRQVLIEATIVEVLLNDNYQSGVDWSALSIGGFGYTIRQNLSSARLNESPFFSLQYSNPSAAAGGNLSSTIKLLDTFGTTRVLSSPRIMTLNNQTAVLKVVENTVYFSLKATVGPVDPLTNRAGVAFDTIQNVVPVGFIMNVTPQISENDVIVLNVRPSVSKITKFARDPNPALGSVQNLVPEIQTREFESILRIASGQTAILGGLMQDTLETSRDGLPILSRIPLFGDAVSYRNDTTRKSELVIFLRPLVIRDASIDTDLAEYRKFLPDKQFFKDADPLIPGIMPPYDLKPNPVVPEPNPAAPPQPAP